MLDVFLDAVDLSDHPVLSIDLLPETHGNCKKVACDWNERSKGFGLYYGCLTAIDGRLCTIEQPSDIENPADFFSDHYYKFGMNVQEMCDVNLRIYYLSVSGNGGTNYTRAFKKLYKLRKWLLPLPDGFFIIKDNAYALLNKLLIPFSGGNEQDANNDTYNFYLYQLRIWIETTFGRLTTKWRIF